MCKASKTGFFDLLDLLTIELAAGNLASIIIIDRIDIILKRSAFMTQERSKSKNAEKDKFLNNERV
jgi:hypothetical protein